jgi:siderophore synthetase component
VTTPAAPASDDALAADPRSVRADLAHARPDLLDRYDAALPGARAQILSRLYGALAREPLPGVAHRSAPGTVVLDDGRVLDGPAGAAQPFADVAAGLAVRLDGVAHDDPGALLAALRLPGHTARLAAELDDSVAHLALARAAQPDPHGGPPALAALVGDGPDAGARAEQLVVDGHPLHPGCRARGGMSVADVLRYAPEHRPTFRLRRLRAPAEKWHGDGPPVLLAHPWQAARLLEAYRWLADDGDTGPVRPLMSLRTVAPVRGGDHIKTAVDVQLTSAVRGVSPAAVHNGPRLSALLATLTADLPTLHVLAEHGAGGVLVEGRPDRSLAHLRRTAPAVAADEIAVPLAVFAAPSPADGRPLLAELLDGYGGDPYAWLADLAAVLLPPMLTVLARGVALEAHGQNTLVVLHAGRPVRICYRDLGGVRVSPARLRAAGVPAPRLIGDLSTDDPAALRAKLAAALLSTVVAEQVALLARLCHADPGRLWAIIARAIAGVDSPDRDHLLGDPLPIKAMTAMRLAADPLDDIWAHLDNPMGHA